MLPLAFWRRIILTAGLALIFYLLRRGKIQKPSGEKPFFDFKKEKIIEGEIVEGEV